jgi:hypothetical protein
MDRLISLDFDADLEYEETWADILGLPESGVERDYRTVTGSFRAVGHEIILETLGLQWQSLVFFHSMGNPAHAFVGRRGWLDRVRLGIVHRRRRLFLGMP